VVMLKGAASMVPVLMEIQLVDNDFAELLPASAVPPASSGLASDTSDILNVFGETVEIHRNTITYGQDGAAHAETWSLQFSCLADIQPWGGDLKTGDVGDEKRSTHRIFFPSGADVIPGDRVRPYGWTTGADEYTVDFILSEEGHVEVAATIVRGSA